MAMIPIDGLNRADVLAALYNASRPLGFGIRQYQPMPMNREEAEYCLEACESKYFGYLLGRVMKVTIAGNAVDTTLYDRDNGEGAGARAIEALRNTRNVNDKSIVEAHVNGLQESLFSLS